MAWLMREKGKKRSVALLISCRKHKIKLSDRNNVSKLATKINKGVPLFGEDV